MNRMKLNSLLLRRIPAFFLACLVLTGCLFSTAAYAEGEPSAPLEEGEAAETEDLYRFTISTAEEFLAFAENCRVDEWSVGRTVILEKDINLLGTGFEGIASFSGTFLGNHHTISNLNLTHGDGSIGMIRYLESSGTIKNLTVRGIVKSSRATDILGGIVGINAGSVTGCAFSGAVKGTGIAGGIVGINGASGAVTLCANSGSMTSQNTVGGIVGQNFGAVTDCTNSGNVNSDSSWVDSSSEEERTVADTISVLTNGLNIGGIVGWNSGLIASCHSSGITGYRRSGQNVGGIAGFTSGDIIGCSHSGKVYGKQNVGGIAGHVEPFVRTEDSESIRAEVESLHSMINTAINDLDALTGTMHTDLGDMTTYAGTITDTAKTISDELVDVVNRNIDVVNDLSGRVDYVSRHLPGVFDHLDAALDSLKKVNEDLDISGKLEDSEYQPTAHNRVALLHTVGGALSADNRNPAEGAEVIVTTEPDTGYLLTGLTVQPNGAEENELTPESDGKYHFTMPAEDVTFRASFEDAGTAPVKIISTNMSGSASYEEDGAEIVVTVMPDVGFGVESIVVTDLNGDGLAVQKPYADSDIYRFSHDAVSCAITFAPRSDKDTVDAAKDRIDRNVDDVADATGRASELIEEIRDLLTDDNGEPRDPGDLNQDELDELEQKMLDLMDALGDAAEASGEIAQDAALLGQVLDPYLEDALNDVNRDVDEMADALQGALSETRSIVDYLNSLEKLKAVKFSDDFSRNSDALSTRIHTLLDIMQRLNDNLNLHSDRLERDMRNINDQLDKVLGMILDRIDNLESMAEGGDLWEDHSVDDAGQDENTRLRDCSNLGLVDGNTAVGGIAGDIQAEIRELGDHEVSVGRKYLASALVEHCSNEGIVDVKKESGGGIVGSLSLGLVRNCVAGGGVFGRDADYLGGIAGRSSGTLQSCSSLAQLEGNQYIGGIAGSADKIHDCLSMATIPVSGGRVGAIAGADGSDGEKDETLYRLTLRERITGNRYVSNRLYGIDGISYVGVAEPISYRQMTAEEDIPSQFLHLQVVFVDDENQIVQRTALPYGASLAELEYPQLTTEGSGYMAWEQPATETMEGSIILRAGVTANVTILPSQQKSFGKALALAEGIFTEDALLNVTQVSLPAPENLPRNAQTAMVALQLENTALTDSSVTRVRLLQQGSGSAAVLALRDGDWEEQPTEQIGQYLQAEMSGTEQTFCIVTVPDREDRLLLCIGGGAAVVLSVGAFLILRRRKRAGGNNGNAADEGTSEPHGE